MADRRAELRRVSRSAFGQDHRLELMLAIARSEDGIFTLSELVTALEVGASSLQRPLGSLIETALVSPLPSSESRFRHYTRNQSPAWQWAEQLASLAEERAIPMILPPG